MKNTLMKMLKLLLLITRASKAVAAEERKEDLIAELGAQERHQQLLQKQASLLSIR